MFFAIFGRSNLNFEKMRKNALRYRVVNVLSKFGGNRIKTGGVMGVNVMVGRTVTGTVTVTRYPS